jgi:hypothetical protein
MVAVHGKKVAKKALLSQYIKNEVEKGKWTRKPVGGLYWSI